MSISSKYFTISILGSYLFFCLFHNIVLASFCIFGETIVYISEFFPSKNMFLTIKHALRVNGVKGSIFVIQSNIYNQEYIYITKIF